MPTVPPAIHVPFFDPPPKPGLINARQVGFLCGVHSETVLRLCRKRQHGFPLPKRLGGPRTLRWDPIEVAKWLQAREREVASRA